MMLKAMNGKGYICYFIFNYELAKNDGLKILEFTKTDSKWLNFIRDNRIYEKPHNWDIVIGPTADGSAYIICNKYDRGLLSVDEAIKKLNPDYYSTQVLFHTDRSIREKYLKEVKS